MTKRREPLPTLSGVYFVSPTEASVRPIIEDFKYKPLYKTAHIFFSSRVPPNILAEIKACSGLTAKLRSLKEVTFPPALDRPILAMPCGWLSGLGWVLKLSALESVWDDWRQLTMCPWLQGQSLLTFPSGACLGWW